MDGLGATFIQREKSGMYPFKGDIRGGYKDSCCLECCIFVYG